MLDEAIVMALVMFVVSLLRNWLLKYYTEEKIKQYFVPVLVLLLAIVFNTLNAFIFGDGVGMKDALAQGISLGVYASGIYGLGKAALGKS